MMNILLMESIPKTLNVFLWASEKFREATVLRKKVKAAEAGDPIVLVGVTVIEEGAKPRVAAMSKSELEALLASQPLKDGFANWAEMERVQRATRAG